MTLHHGDCRDVLPTLADASVDAVVTDPPYELGFMGKRWDSSGIAYDVAMWAEVLRVLKPGGHLLAFGGTRTSHRLTCAIEDAGFEIRDSIAWLHGQGFPKGKSQLKPAHEPVTVARKPGKSVLQVDACRIAHGADVNLSHKQRQHQPTSGMSGLGESGFRADHVQPLYSPAGRWPANVVLDESQAAALDEQSGNRPGSHAQAHLTKPASMFTGCTIGDEDGYRDSGGASRFFFVAKASTKERPKVDGVAHPTVKPLNLMRWLVRLVTPPGGVVLDPFAGSGTTLGACQLEGFDCIGIEREAEYLPLIAERLAQTALSA